MRIPSAYPFQKSEIDATRPWDKPALARPEAHRGPTLLNRPAEKQWGARAVSQWQATLLAQLQRQQKNAAYLARLDAWVADQADDLPELTEGVMKALGLGDDRAPIAARIKQWVDNGNAEAPLDLNDLGPRDLSELPLPDDLRILDLSRCDDLYALPEHPPASLEVVYYSPKNGPLRMEKPEPYQPLLVQPLDAEPVFAKYERFQANVAYFAELDAWAMGADEGEMRADAIENIKEWVLNGVPSNPLTLSWFGLRELPPLPAGLKSLFANDNRLTWIPDLPDGITTANFDNNELTSLSALPASLRWLHVANNKLTRVPEGPSLEGLHADFNPFSREDWARLGAPEENRAGLLQYLREWEEAGNPEQPLDLSGFANLKSLPEHLPDDVRVLDISRCKQISRLPKAPPPLLEVVYLHPESRLVNEPPSAEYANRLALCIDAATTPDPLIRYARFQANIAYFAELDAWATRAEADEQREKAVDVIKKWVLAGDPTPALRLGSLGLLELPRLPDGVRILDATNNRLTDPPELPDGIEVVMLDDNDLTVPPVLPASVCSLYIDNNELTYLPQNHELDELHADFNPLPPEDWARLGEPFENREGALRRIREWEAEWEATGDPERVLDLSDFEDLTSLPEILPDNVRVIDISRAFIGRLPKRPPDSLELIYVHPSSPLFSTDLPQAYRGWITTTIDDDELPR